MPRSALPVWPLVVMFGLTPLWWLLGGLYLFWPVLAAVLAALLITRGRVVLPTGSVAWVVFVALIVVSAVRMDRASGFLMYSLRLAFVLSALVVYLYVYNAARSGTSWRRLFRPLCLFWLAMVALGWIGVFAPTFSMTTPVELVLPHLTGNGEMVQALTHIHATEFNPLGRNPYYRTAAPYPYTNNWGTGFAILVPCVLAYLSSVRHGPLRIVLIVSLPLSLVPAFLTLNRGMFIGLGAGLVYLGLRALRRGDTRLIASIAGLTLVVWIGSLLIPVGDLITQRVTNTTSTSDRLDLYVKTFQAVLRSPLLGFGGPRMVDTTQAAEPLGTQGQVWLVMYSHGIPALLCFGLFFVLVARRLAAAVSPAGRWLSAVPVIAVVIMPFYGYTDINMSVMFFAFGLAAAAVDGPVNRPSSVPADPAVPRPGSTPRPGGTASMAK